MDWFIRLIKGTIVGIGAILPGLSGGVMAVIFGIYDPLIRFLADIRKDFVKNFRYFLPIVIGVGLGFILFSAVVSAAFGKYEAQFVCLFIGFVLGTLPSLIRTAGERGRSGGHLLIMAVTAALLFAMLMMGQQSLTQVTPNLVVWFFSGMVFALGFIVPGMSPSNFLIYFGLYDKMAEGIKNLDFTMMIPFGLGAVACVLLLSRLMAFLFDRFYAGTHHFILGTVIGSSLVIFPVVVFPALSGEGLAASGLSFPVALLICLLMLIIGVIVSYLFSRFEEKVERKPLIGG
ncbi:DUF368 domain-containing protein [Anaerolineaceae bacterium oral taxon 439]|nr:DUF368 domain-containing protein [Anaerolineaceae bacterium oral taxon 439]